MKRLKGPELKMPDLKVPPFMRNLYWDLHDRRLLPLVVLVVLAIVVAPFALAGDSTMEPPGGADPGGSISGELENADRAGLVVVEAKPGLRDYRKRLAGRTPTDPFKQHLVPVHRGNGAQLPDLPAADDATTTEGSGSGGEESSSTGDNVESSPAPAPENPSSSKGGSARDGGENADEGNGSGDPTLLTFTIDVRIARSGGRDADAKETSKASEPVIKHGVLPQTPLPGEKAPVVTYLGRSRKGNALLLVSTDVKSVFGETKCVSGDDACQLIEAEPGFPVTFVYGYNEVHYSVKVLKIEPVRVPAD